MTEPRHPPQREMWDGLTPFGCLSLIAFLVIVTVIMSVFGNY